MSSMASDSARDDPVIISVAADSEHADEYEASHGPKMLDRVERFAASLPVRSLILDAGCGPGRDLARFVSFGHVAQGVDLNPVFVAMATAHAPTLQADLRKVQQLFPQDLFDGIWASASLVHLTDEDTSDVLRQFASLLRPGAKLYVCVNTVGQTGWLDEPDGRRWYTIWTMKPSSERLREQVFSSTRSIVDRSSRCGQRVRRRDRDMPDRCLGRSSSPPSEPRIFRGYRSDVNRCPGGQRARLAWPSVRRQPGATECCRGTRQLALGSQPYGLTLRPWVALRRGGLPHPPCCPVHPPQTQGATSAQGDMSAHWGDQAGSGGR